MSAEVWRFVAVVIFFAVVLIAAYWFVILPDRWVTKLDQSRQAREGDHRDQGRST